MNTATYLQQKKWQPRARRRVLMRGLAPRAMMAAGVGLLMGFPAPVVYAHGGDPSKVHACVKPPGGQTRIVGPSVSCAANETAADWSITGSGLGALDDLGGLPCTTADGQPAAVKIMFTGPFAMLACAVAQSGRFFDLGLTVYDTQTGLQWEKKVAGSGCLHCVNDTYTWCAATGNDGGAGGLGECIGNTTSWIAQVNAGELAGHTDWRLPTSAELQTFFTASTICSSDPIFGPNEPAEYWSTTTGGGFPKSQGCSSGGDSSALTPLSVRAVRQGAL